MIIAAAVGGLLMFLTRRRKAANDAVLNVVLNVILIRGLGPSLSNFGIPNPLADPTLELRDSNGALLASNDNCAVSPLPPPNPVESCIGISLPPAAYTAILAGKDGGTGIGLVEIYNLQ